MIYTNHFTEIAFFKTFSFKVLLVNLHSFSVSKSKQSLKLFLFSFSTICIEPRSGVSEWWVLQGPVRIVEAPSKIFSQTFRSCVGNQSVAEVGLRWGGNLRGDCGLWEKAFKCKSVYWWFKCKYTRERWALTAWRGRVRARAPKWLCIWDGEREEGEEPGHSSGSGLSAGLRLRYRARAPWQPDEAGEATEQGQGCPAQCPAEPRVVRATLSPQPGQASGDLVTSGTSGGTEAHHQWSVISHQSVITYRKTT